MLYFGQNEHMYIQKVYFPNKMLLHHVYIKALILFHKLLLDGRYKGYTGVKMVG